MPHKEWILVFNSIEYLERLINTTEVDEDTYREVSDIIKKLTEIRKRLS